jgi:hypothetical protein
MWISIGGGHEGDFGSGEVAVAQRLESSKEKFVLRMK